MNQNRRFEDRIEPALDRVARFVYGSGLPIIADTAVVVLPPHTETNVEIPRFTQTHEGAQLQISELGARRWEEKLTIPCDEVDIHPHDLYTTAAVAQLELVSAAQTSLTSSGDMNLAQRVMKSYKMIDSDDQVKQRVSEIAESTEISMTKILAAFDYEQLIKLNMLRYGIGVALASMGLKPTDIKDFQTEAKNQAVISMNSYYSAAASYLGAHFISPNDITHRVDGVYHIDSPLIEVASSSPMNVSYLFDDK